MHGLTVKVFLMISWQGASSQFTKSARPCDEMIAGYSAGELGQLSWIPSIRWTAKANTGKTLKANFSTALKANNSTAPKAKNSTTRGRSDHHGNSVRETGSLA